MTYTHLQLPGTDHLPVVTAPSTPARQTELLVASLANQAIPATLASLAENFQYPDNPLQSLNSTVTEH